MSDWKPLLAEIMAEKIEQRLVRKLRKHYGQDENEGIQISNPFERLRKHQAKKKKEAQ